MICSKDKCVGCFACKNICPKNAITMVEDEYGNIYPNINKDKCVKCGLCRKVCQGINENKINLIKSKSCYAALSMQQIENTSSGGIATVCSEYILNNNGIVYGAAFEKGFKIHHIRINNVKDLEKLKGSKYVHSYIENSYSTIKQDLQNGLKVLFIGTPCQVFGLKLFLMRDYDNLICIDIICHGVPSQKFLKDELGYQYKEIDSLSFRNDGKYKLVAKINNKIVFSKNNYASEYYTGFLNGTFYRENCYNCNFSKVERCSDITLGDFWKLNEKCELLKYKRNVSVVLINTDKGEDLFKKLKSKIYFEKRDLSEAVNGNAQLKHPGIKNKDFEIFHDKYNKFGFKKAYHISNPYTMFYSFIKTKIKIMLKPIYKFIKLRIKTK